MDSAQIVYAGSDTSLMAESGDDVWLRVDAELKARGKGWPWLRDRLGYSDGRVGNWKSRGIPTAEYANIALAMDESVDWVSGLAPPKRQDPDKLTAMARKVAFEFDTITDDEARLTAFAKVISAIASVRGA